MDAVDELKPSLFELLAEQQLSSLLPPTLRYLLTVATHRYPRYLLRILNSFDEIYAVTMLIVERHYLKTRGGSFTENFYGLKRERALASGIELPRASTRAPTIVHEQLQLGKADVWKNLLVLVILPYLRRKVEEHHDVNAPRALLGTAYTRLPPNPTLKDRLIHWYRWFLLNIFPRAHAAYGLLMLAFNLAYISENARLHNPLMWLVKTRIRRMGPADYKAIDDMAKKTAEASAKAAAGSMLNPRNLGPRMLSSFSMLLPASIFALKFLEWWYASDFAKQLSRKAAEDIELPLPMASGMQEAKRRKEEVARKGNEKEAGEGQQEAEGGVKDGEDAEADAENAPIALPSMLPVYTVSLPEDSALCPICEDDIATATACQSGVVYCYSCIHRWVEGSHPRQERFMAGKNREGKWEDGKGRCAVTGRRVLGSTEGLRRIMV